MDERRMTGHAGRPAIGVVPRPALYERLDRGVVGPVTLVAAPAGSGKTVLVRSWLAGRDHPAAAWVSVDRGESDGQRFWNQVVQALGDAVPELTAGLPEPTPEFDGDTFVDHLASRLAGLREPLVLVLDDLHELVADDALEQLRYLLEHLPDLLHVVLVSRRDPHLGLHLHRVAGLLTELRSGDLRFAPGEMRTLLAGSGVVLSDEGLQQLHERTEGWAAGVRLAALALASHPDPERFVSEFSGSERTVAEYLLAEVFDAQPARVRHLLVRAALVERVNGSLADALTGTTGTEQDLRALADSGGFVVALDADRTWFRFHHLFADLLALQLRHTEPAEIPRLHLVAARWYADQGWPVEAIAHAAAGGDHEQAAGLLIEHYFSLTLDGRGGTARALLDTVAPVPATVVAPEVLSVLAAEELVTGSLDQAEAYLALAERHAPAVPEQRRSRFATSLLLTRSSIARRRGDFRALAVEMQPAVPADEPRTGGDLDRRNDVATMTLLNLGIIEVWSGRFEEGVGHLEEAAELAERTDRPYLQVSCLAHRASAIGWRSLTRARVAGQEAIELAESRGWGADPVIGPALVTWGATLVQAGRLDEAEQMLARAQLTMRTGLEPATGILLHMAFGMLDAAAGAHDAAIDGYVTAGRLGSLLVNESPLRLQLQCSILTSRVAAGDTESVADELSLMTAAERSTGEAREVIAALALAREDGAAASAALAATLDGSAEVHHQLVVVRSLLLDAHARQLLGETVAAEQAVERALDLAEADALVSPFLHVPSRALLDRHPHHRTAHRAFLADVLDLLSGRAVAPARPRPAPVVEELSDTELRVLRFLPTNMPVGAIAAEMYLSANTIKTHLRHIYAKLAAHSRSDAVDRARELGLLGGTARRA